MRRAAAALSEHPVAAEATAEVIGDVLDAIGPAPDLAVVFVSGDHVRALEQIAATVRVALAPGTLVGATAATVVGGARAVEGWPAVSLWAARTGPARAVRLSAAAHPGGVALLGADELADAAGTLVLVAAPGPFPMGAVLDELAAVAPALSVVGGVASASAGTGADRLVVDADVHADGAVGALVDPGAGVTALVSQGCRPIGEPMTVTAADGPALLGLAGQPALDRFRQLVAGTDDAGREVMRRGVHLGVVVAEHKVDFERGDFLIRPVVGSDAGRDAVVVGDVVPVGAVVQFQVRDASAADDDLRAVLAGRSADAALLFTDDGRGARLFADADHDAAVLADVAGPAVAGMGCAGEVGPVGARSWLHGQSASMLLFDRPPTRRGARGAPLG